MLRNRSDILQGTIAAQNGAAATGKLETRPFTIASFNLIESTVSGYRRLVVDVREILAVRLQMLDELLTRALANDAEEDVRLARGKIIVICKNNLNKFESLLAVRFYSI